MARRNREINIFNMSLLDILCGALGAFCFMMLALLPYYKPPGTETVTRENQQKTEELMKKIKEAGQKMDSSPAVEDLRQLVEELRQQIQVMQGQLNQALSKNEELTRVNASLTAQNDALAKQNAALAEENEKLKEMLKRMTSADALAEMQKRIEQLEGKIRQMNDQLRLAESQKQELRAKNDVLADANAGLQQKVRNRTPITIVLRFSTTQSVDIFVEDLTPGTNGPEFDPIQRRSAPLWTDDIYFYGPGYSSYSLVESSPKAEFRVFVNLVTLPKYIADTSIGASVSFGTFPDIVLPRLDLTPARPWALYGTLKKDADGKLAFKPASQAERDAVWEQISKAKAPATPSPKAVVTPPPRPESKPLPVPNAPPVRPPTSPGSSTPPPAPTSDRQIPAPARNP